MTSVATHPATTIVRGVAHAYRRPRLRPASAVGPLGARFEPFAPATIADRAGAYRRLHAQPGVHPVGRELYALASYDHVRAGARAHRSLASGKGVSMVRTELPMLLTVDRPRHAELRRLLGPQFTAERAGAMQPAMRSLAAAAVERMLARPNSDAVSEIAVPLPITVIARLLGVPERDLGLLHRLSDGIVEGFHAGSSLRSIGHGLRSGATVVALHRYMRRLFARLRREPGDDVISALLASNAGGRTRDDELFWLSLMLLVAGNETTTNLIGSLLYALARDPGAYERLRSEPALIGPAVDEGLRWGSPIQGMFRTVIDDYPVGPTTIPAGARVLLLFGAANRDPGRYPDPDRFAVERRPADHVGFGSGIHFCLGAHLARAEATVVIEELVRRTARLELAGPVAWRDNPTVHGPSRLPLRLAAA
jgi:cytochrome P450